VENLAFLCKVPKDSLHQDHHAVHECHMRAALQCCQAILQNHCQILQIQNCCWNGCRQKSLLRTESATLHDGTCSSSSAHDKCSEWNGWQASMDLLMRFVIVSLPPCGRQIFRGPLHNGKKVRKLTAASAVSMHESIESLSQRDFPGVDPTNSTWLEVGASFNGIGFNWQHLDLGGLGAPPNIVSVVSGTMENWLPIILIMNRLRRKLMMNVPHARPSRAEHCP